MTNDDEPCPVCADRSTFSGNPAASFCDTHYRQYLATFQVAPKDLSAYRASRKDRDNG
jgi:hypothetical protein